MEKPSIRPVFKFFVPFVLLLFFLAALIAAGFYGLQNNKRLDSEGKPAAATVIDWRDDQWEVMTIRPYSRTKLDPQYYIKYVFTPKGETNVYTCGGQGDTRASWCKIEHDDWVQSKSTGKIDIVYLPRSPEINRPLHIPDGGGTSSSIGALWLISSVVFLMILWAGFQYNSARKDPANTLRRHFLWRTV